MRKDGGICAMIFEVLEYRCVSAFAIMNPSSLQRKQSIVQKRVGASQPKVQRARSKSNKRRGEPFSSLMFSKNESSLETPSLRIIHRAELEWEM